MLSILLFPFSSDVTINFKCQIVTDIISSGIWLLGRRPCLRNWQFWRYLWLATLVTFLIGCRRLRESFRVIKTCIFAIDLWCRYKQQSDFLLSEVPEEASVWYLDEHFALRASDIQILLKRIKTDCSPQLLGIGLKRTPLPNYFVRGPPETFLLCQLTSGEDLSTAV